MSEFTSFVLVVIIFTYFIREQFELKRIHPLDYIAIPIFAVIKFFLNFPQTLNLPIVITFFTIFIVAVLIGLFQAQHVIVKVGKGKRNIYYDQDGHEQYFYRKEVYASGGWRYLLGWCIIFVTQILLIIFVLHSQTDYFELFKTEIIKDVLVIFNFVDISPWYTWEVIAITNITYILRLCQKYPEVKMRLFNR